MNFTTAVGDSTKREEQARKNLPKIEDVVEQTLVRQEFLRDDILGGNFNFVSFVSFYFSDTLNSKPGTNGTQMASESDRLANLAQVYGRDNQRQMLLRSGVDGKMRTSTSAQNETVALMWSDVSLEEQLANGYNATERFEVFVGGYDSINNHWGNVFWTTIYNLEHNRICDELISAAAKDNVTFTDQELFTKTRIILMQINARLVLESYASDHFLGLSSRLHFNSGSCFSPLVNIPTTYNMDYTHAYTFHQAIPDNLYYNDNQNFSLARDIFRRPAGYENFTKQEHFDAWYQTPSGALFGRNIPGFLSQITVQQIADARANNLASYNDFAEFYGYDRLESFENLGVTEEVAASLNNLYESVDDLDLHVGMLLGQGALSDRRATISGEQSPVDPVRRSIIIHEIASNVHSLSCYKDTSLYTEEFLTKRGLELVDESTFVLVDLLGRHGISVQDNTPFSRVTRQINAVAPPAESELRFENLLDYCGFDDLWDFALNFDEFYLFFIATMSAFLTMILAYTVGTYTFEAFLYRERKDAKVMTHYLITGIVYTLQVPYYSYAAYKWFFSSRFEEVSREVFFGISYMTMTHAGIYLVDVALRKKTELKWFLLLHHTIWFATLFIALAAKDVFTLKIGIIFDYFSLFEFGLFFLLFWSKYKNRVLTYRAKILARLGLVLFFATRVVQTVFLFYLVIGSGARMVKYNRIFFLVFGVFVVGLVSLVQLYTVYLYALWKNLWTNGDDVPKTNEKTKEQMTGVVTDNCQLFTTGEDSTRRPSSFSYSSENTEGSPSNPPSTRSLSFTKRPSPIADVQSENCVTDSELNTSP
eukprot:Pgem_evm1s10018